MIYNMIINIVMRYPQVHISAVTKYLFFGKMLFATKCVDSKKKTLTQYCEYRLRGIENRKYSRKLFSIRQPDSCLCLRVILIYDLKNNTVGFINVCKIYANNKKMINDFYVLHIF